MAKPDKTFVDVVELDDDKLLLIAVLTSDQLEEINAVFEPLSRRWRGQYQSLAKAVVEAYHKWKSRVP